MIRLAALGDIHVGADSRGEVRPGFERLADEADVLLLAGDLTRYGEPAEVAVLLAELLPLPVPTVAVLGNHDYHSDRQDEITVLLESAGVTVLEGEAALLDVNGTRLGVAGTKGFGGGFRGASGADFGEPEMKGFVRHTRAMADRLSVALDELDCDVKVALLHYSPVADTLAGERLEIYPFLGSYLLGDAVDRSGAALVLHGHAHLGTECGLTPGGIPVRNVAQPVIGRPYTVYPLNRN